MAKRKRIKIPEDFLWEHTPGIPDDLDYEDRVVAFKKRVSKKRKKARDAYREKAGIW